MLRIAICTWRSISADNISLLAAGVAFYSLLAIFPGLAFIIALFGLMADPAQVQQQLLSVKEVLPEEAWTAINSQITALTQQTNRTLSLASIVSITLAFVNARLAATAMMGALNVVYKREETRTFIRTNIIALSFTVGALAIFALNIYAVAAVPQVMKALGLSQLSSGFLQKLTWPVLGIVMALGLALTYRFGPDRPPVHWRWVTLGSLSATGLWLVASAAFSWYVSNFNTYDKIYGSFGAVVILLYWFWLTAFAALLGAELDHQIQTEVEDRS